MPGIGRHGENELAGPEYLAAGLQLIVGTCQITSDMGKEPVKQWEQQSRTGVRKQVTTLSQGLAP